MARPKATPEQREEIRRGIQLAAAAIYRETGIGGISARAVAKEAGVSVGAIYAHFGDLTTLMQSLWMGHVDKQNAKFEAVAQEHADPVERMSALMRAYLNFGIKNAQLYRSAFLFVRPESHDTPEVQPLASMAFGALLIAAIQEGQSAGTVMPGEPEIIVQVLWSGLHGALALPINFDRLQFSPTGDIADDMVEALIRAVTI